MLTAGEDHEADLRAHGFDPQLLREERYGGLEGFDTDCFLLRVSTLCRELRLQEASRRPLFGSSMQHASVPKQNYPHVYDSLAAVRMTSAFIAGSKVSFYIF